MAEHSFFTELLPSNIFPCLCTAKSESYIIKCGESHLFKDLDNGNSISNYS